MRPLLYLIYLTSAIAAALFFLQAAHAVAVDDSPLPDQAQEEKAREIMGDIRCLVCQNQSIEDSNAPLAKDLRNIVRTQIAAGKSSSEIKAYLVERYGDWVLLKPPFNVRTLVLWLFPPFLLLGALLFIFTRARQDPESPAPAPLSREEQDRLNRILARNDAMAESHAPRTGRKGDST